MDKLIKERRLPENGVSDLVALVRKDFERVSALTLTTLALEGTISFNPDILNYLY